VTGYKAHELGVFNDKHPGIKYIKKALEKRISSLLDEGLEWVIISGQLGVELWAAEVVLEFKLEFPELQLAVITPFLEQEKNWNEQKQEYYRSILEEADFVTSVTKREYEGPWQFKDRNQFLLDHTDGMLIIYDEENVGTPKYILDEAIARMENDGYELIIMNSYDLQVVVEEEQEKEAGFKENIKV
jgi:uncharacterized phage-like protein YoqJ